MFYWILKRVLLGPLLRVLFRPWTEGEEHVPQTGPAIFASNHLSFSDSIFLPVVVPRRITFPAKMEYFTGRGVKGRVVAAFFRGVGQIPIDRSGGKASMAALSSGLKVLRRGEIFGIYPEGTRSPDGRLYRGKTGVARLALESGAPVIPVAMIGTDIVQPTGRLIPRLGRVGIRFGRPLDFSRYAGMEEDRHILRSITDEVMYELMLLSGQEYVDVYAASVKNRLVAAVQKGAHQIQGVAKSTLGRDESDVSAAGDQSGPVDADGGTVVGLAEGPGDALGDVGRGDVPHDALAQDDPGPGDGEPRSPGADPEAGDERRLAAS